MPASNAPGNGKGKAKEIPQGHRDDAPRASGLNPAPAPAKSRSTASRSVKSKPYIDSDDQPTSQLDPSNEQAVVAPATSKPRNVNPATSRQSVPGSSRQASGAQSVAVPAKDTDKAAKPPAAAASSSNAPVALAPHADSENGKKRKCEIRAPSPKPVARTKPAARFQPATPGLVESVSLSRFTTPTPT